MKSPERDSEKAASPSAGPDASPSDPRIAQAAAVWVARRDRGLTPTQERELVAWCDADPRHAAEFARLSGTWHTLDSVRHVTELEAMADAFVVRARAKRTRRRVARFVLAFGTAAAVVAVGFLGWQRLGTAAHPPGGIASANENYRVLASTLRRTVLADGSVAELNGASRIEIDYSPAERRVRLVEGEAHFIVAENPSRPFFVTAGSVTVRAVGTAFNVRLASETIEVLVTEGKVKVANDASALAAKPAASPAPESTSVAAASDAGAPLVQGQRAVIPRRSDPASGAMQIGDVPKTEIDETLGWQSTRLVFNNTPLDEAVDGFNRYNPRQLTLGDPALRKRTLSGTFRADNLEGFLRIIRFTIDVKAEQRTPTETVLLPIR